MPRRIVDLIERWCDLARIDPSRRPDPAEAGACLKDAARPGVEPAAVAAWEWRHGFELPDGLKLWLGLSDGLFADGPMIHPLAAIGPMVPFARVPGMIVQPESWFELGNPNVETVCLDLAYRGPGGDFPVFTSGDDATGSAPRLIADGFEAWFLGLLAAGGREYWFDRDFADLGDPWTEHCRRVPPPKLTARLSTLADRVSPMVRAGVDDRAIAASFGISRFDVEAIARHVQHARPQAARAADAG